MSSSLKNNDVRLDIAFVTIGLLITLICLALALVRQSEFGIFELISLERRDFWAFDRGFGLPIPFGNIEAIPQLNPFFLIAEFFSIDEFRNSTNGEEYSNFESRIATTTLYKTLSALGTCTFLVFCLRGMGIGWIITLIGVISYLFSGVIVSYYYNNVLVKLGFHFWSFPVLLFFLNRIGNTKEFFNQVYWGCIFALVFSISFLSGHTGSFYVNVFSLTVVGIVMAMHNRRLLKILLPVSFVIVLSVSWKLGFLATEIFRFGHVPRAVDGTYTGALMIVFDGFIKPIFRPSFGELWGAYTSNGVRAVIGTFVGEYLAYNGTKSMFWIGPVFAASAIVGVFSIKRKRDPFFRGLVVAFLACLLSACIPNQAHLSVPSFEFIFLGPASVLGILIGAKIIDDYGKEGGIKASIFVALGIQMFCLALGSGPMFAKHFQETERVLMEPEAAPWTKPVITSLKQDIHNKEFVRILTFPPLMSKKTSKTSFPRKVEALENIADVNAVSFYISYNDFWPGSRLQENYPVKGYEPLGSSSLLDVIGIRFLVTNRSQAVTPALYFRGKFDSLDGDEVALHENVDPWQIATLMDYSAANMPINYLIGCPHRKIMCIDFDAFRKQRLGGELNIYFSGDQMFVELAPKPTPALLFVSQMYRDGWQAQDQMGKPLEIIQIQGGFLGVKIPADSSSVHLAYRPPLLYWARTISVIGMVALFVMVILLSLLWIFRRKTPITLFSRRAGGKHITNVSKDPISRKTLNFRFSSSNIIKFLFYGLSVFLTATGISIITKLILLQFGMELELNISEINNISFYIFSIIIVGPPILIWSKTLTRTACS